MYLTIGIYTSREAALGQNVPEVQAYFAAHPNTAYTATPPTIEAYHVIHRM